MEEKYCIRGRWTSLLRPPPRETPQPERSTEIRQTGYARRLTYQERQLQRPSIFFFYQDSSFYSSARLQYLLSFIPGVVGSHHVFDTRWKQLASGRVISVFHSGSSFKQFAR